MVDRIGKVSELAGGNQIPMLDVRLKMGYPQERRFEIWFTVTVTGAIALSLSLIAVLKDASVVWVIAAPFFLLLPLLVWKAKRPDSVFDDERAKSEMFFSNHPVLAALLIIGGVIAGVWSLVGGLLELIR